MGLLRRSLMLFAVLVCALTFGVFVNGHRAHSWFRNPEEYDYKDYDYRMGELSNVEFLNCSSIENGVPVKCVPLDMCPQSRFQRKRLYCRSGSTKDDGPFICCPSFRPGPQNKPPNAVTTSPVLSSKGDKNSETHKPSSQPFNGITTKRSINLTPRGGPDGNSDCGLLEKDGKNKLGTRIRGSLNGQPILGAAIGGISVSSASQSPWTVAIGEYTKEGSVDWFCGGSLLSQFTVLTAAHCARRRRPEVVRVGEIDLRRNTRIGEGKGEDIRIKDVTMHPDYRPPSYYNDIAVLTLERPVDLRRPGGARTICLPPPVGSQSSDEINAYNGKEAILTGWGHLSFGGDRSPILQEVRVTVFSNEECSRSYSAAAAATVTKRSYPSGIVNSQLCAGDRQGKKDACQGDSGGPLVVKSKDGKHSVIGVVSSGIGCGSKQYPGVYVRVSSYVDWIADRMV